jgi:hypothetical protein
MTPAEPPPQRFARDAPGMGPERPRKKRRRHKSQGMAVLAELVPSALPKTLPAHAKLARITALWERSVPPRVAREVVPVRFRDGTLHLHTRAAVWAQEVSLMGPKLVEQMRARDPRMPVDRLAPRVGPMPERVPIEPEPAPLAIVPLEPAQLPAPIRSALDAIADPDLRRSLTELACAALAPIPSQG